MAATYSTVSSAVTSIDPATNTLARSVAPTIPADAVVGDGLLAVGLIRRGGAAATVPVAPSGWLPIANDATNGLNRGTTLDLRIWYRAVVSGDAGAAHTWTWTDDAVSTLDGNGLVAIIRLPGVNTEAMIDAVKFDTSTGTLNATTTLYEHLSPEASVGVQPSPTSALTAGSLIIRLFGQLGTSGTFAAATGTTLRNTISSTGATNNVRLITLTDNTAPVASTQTPARTATTSISTQEIQGTIIIEAASVAPVSTSTALKPVPVRGTTHAQTFIVRDKTTGQPISTATFESTAAAADNKFLLSLDGATPVVSANSVVNIGNGAYRLPYTVAETTATEVRPIVRTATPANVDIEPIPSFFPRDLPVFTSGTFVSAGTSTATLATNALAVNSVYIGMMLQVTGGTGIGQVRTITAYSGSSRTATVSPSWSPTPTVTSTYKVLDPGNTSAIIAQGNDPATGWAAEDYFTMEALQAGIWSATTRSITAPVAIAGAIPYLENLNNIATGDIFAALLADHTVVNSIGAAINTITTAVVANLNATVSSRAAATDLTVIDDFLDTEIADIRARLPAALVSGRIDASVGAMAANVLTDAVAAPDLDVYQARVTLVDDNLNTSDRYVVIWHKNGTPVTSGITSPLIQVWAVSNGADLIPETAMTQIATTGTYRLTAITTARTVAGAAYIARVTATIDGGVRATVVPIGRDS